MASYSAEALCLAFVGYHDVLAVRPCCFRCQEFFFNWQVIFHHGDGIKLVYIPLRR